MFICGGAFSGLEKIIQKRTNNKVIGFGATPVSKKDALSNKILKEVMPQDLHKFGIIPELIGRLPIVVTLDNLDEESLVSILTKPKNAIIKQYTYLFEMDNLELEFEHDAISAIAKKAIAQETGARGLRAILENFMTDIMYEIPSAKNIKKCIITKDVVEYNEKPKFIYNDNNSSKTENINNNLA